MLGAEKMIDLRETLEAIYLKFNQQAYVDPDPLLFLYGYPHVRDREIVALVAACLAYGRVEMIMKTLEQVLEKLGPSPYDFLTGIPKRKGDKQGADHAIETLFQGFKYRFATSGHLSCLVKGIRRVILQYNSLENCFYAGLKGRGENQESTLSGLGHLYREISRAGEMGHLLADPGKTSASKRSHLFLRWMVRRDAVDPGGWEIISPSRLIIPLDTHMYKIGHMLGFTQRKSPDKTCALEITEGFRKIIPHDPVRYDFSLTRFGIRRNLEMGQLSQLLCQGGNCLEL